MGGGGGPGPDREVTRLLRARPARVGVAVAVAGFWLAALTAGAVEPGYDPGRDYLSALASVGAAAPAPGLLMFGCGAAALAAAGVVVQGVVPSARLARRLLLVSAACVGVAGLARVSCSDGAAGCGAGPAVVEQVTLLGRVHSLAVGGYQVAFSLALVALAAAAGRAWRRGLAAFGWTAALGTAVLAVAPLPWGPGTDQRVWVAAGHLVLLVLAAWPDGRPGIGSRP